MTRATLGKSSAMPASDWTSEPTISASYGVMSSLLSTFFTKSISVVTARKRLTMTWSSCFASRPGSNWYVSG